MSMLILFACLASLFVVAERLLPARDQRLLRPGFVTDVLYVPIHFLMRVVINGSLAVLLAGWARDHMPPGSTAVLADSPLWVQVIVLLVVLDFFFYVIHRLKHQWSWWWRLHETHHSSQQLDWLSTTRFHPIEKVLDRVIYLAPLIFLGVSEEALLVWAGVDAFSGMLIHSNLDIRLGPFIYVFNGPEMHGWHHARDPRHQNCNFGNNFSFFDWIFGTAYLTSEKLGRFGIDEPDYPEGNLWRQFWYAFRPTAAAGAPARPDATSESVSA
ncbi:MAG: sterol desaturase family protein [Candidatus Binatia bacterium]